MITKIFENIEKRGEILREWNASYISALYKKVASSKCYNNPRAVGVILLILGIFIRVIRTKIQENMSDLSREQFSYD